MIDRQITVNYNFSAAKRYSPNVLMSNCFYILLIICIFSSNPAYSQGNYNLDSIQTVQFFAPSFSNIFAEGYQYDDQDRLIRKQSEGRFSTFTYEPRLITEVRFSLSEGGGQSEFGRNYTELNEDGFITKRTHTYTTTYGEEHIQLLDSIIRNKENQAIEEYLYFEDWSTNLLKLATITTREYDGDNNNTYLSQEFFALENGTLIFSEKTTKKYNDKGQLIEEVRTNLNSVMYESTLTSRYGYQGHRIDFIEKTSTYDGGYNETRSRDEYVYDLPYSAINHYFLWNDQKTLFQTENLKHSQSSFFEFDSVKVISNPEMGANLISEVANREVANESRDSIFIHEFQKGFNFNSSSVSFFNSRKMFYSRKKQKNLDITLEDLQLYPNPVGLNGQIILQSDAEDYDRFVVVNSLGQLVKKEPINYSYQINIHCDIEASGVYFVRLELGDTAVTSWARFVVQ